MPWQRQVLRDVFGTMDENGERLIQDTILITPKGSSKTLMAAGLCLMFLTTHPTAGTEIYSAATSKEQAGIVFRAAYQMVVNSPFLSKRLRVIPSTKRIVRYHDPTSFYAAISADGDIQDGIAPLFVVRDELHRWRTRKHHELNEVLERSAKTKRKNPLIFDITTAGEMDESSICYHRYEYAMKVNGCPSCEGDGNLPNPHCKNHRVSGLITDRRFYGRVWMANPKRIAEDPTYWSSKEARVEANPSHEDNGGYIKDSVFADMVVKAQNDPSFKSDYLRYHLNIWSTQREDRVIDMDKWITSGGSADLRNWPKYDVDLLIRQWGLYDRLCYAGVDASWTTDLTAFVLIFPPIPEGEEDPLDKTIDAERNHWTLLAFFWIPSESILKHERTDKMPYREWAEKGFIESIQGNAIDTSVIRDKIKWASSMFDLREVGYDRYNFRNDANVLFNEDSIKCIEVKQNYGEVSNSTKWLLGKYLDGEIRHGNNPVLNWNAMCLSLAHDALGNVMPSKPYHSKSSKRIDGISATVTGLARALSVETSRNKLEEVGIRFLGR